MPLAFGSKLLLAFGHKNVQKLTYAWTAEPQSDRRDASKLERGLGVRAYKTVGRLSEHNVYFLTTM